MLRLPLLTLRMAGCWQTRPGPGGSSGWRRRLFWLVSRCLLLAPFITVLLFTFQRALQLMAERQFMRSVQVVGDALAVALFSFKVVALNRNVGNIADISLILETAFWRYELKLGETAKHLNKSHHQQAKRGSQLIFYTYVGLALNVLVVTVAPMFGTKQDRRVSFDASEEFLQTDWLYNLHCCFIIPVGCYSLAIFPAAFDMLYLSLCVHLSCKLKLLRALLISSNAEQCLSWPHGALYGTDADASQYTQSDENYRKHLKECIKYHVLVVHLRDKMEEVFKWTMMVQLLYTLIAVGIPALRLLYDTAERNLLNTIFVTAYALFNFSQLLFACWFGDIVAESSLLLAVSALRGYKPGVTGDCRILLHMFMLRSQKTLFLTANNFTNLNLELFLNILRRSQSIYSAILNVAL